MWHVFKGALVLSPITKWYNHTPWKTLCHYYFLYILFFSAKWRQILTKYKGEINVQKQPAMKYDYYDNKKVESKEKEGKGFCCSSSSLVRCWHNKAVWAFLITYLRLLKSKKKVTTWHYLVMSLTHTGFNENSWISFCRNSIGKWNSRSN